MITPDFFGAMIKKIRAAEGLKQEQLALTFKVQVGTVGMWEIGKAFPADEKLPILAKMAGKDPSDLFHAKISLELERRGVDVARFVRWGMKHQRLQNRRKSS